MEEGTIEKREDAERPRSSSAYWQAELALSDKEEKDWRDRAKKVVDRYRDDKEREGSRFNILYSNTETLKPALYARTANPDVRRRFADRDPVGRQVAEIIERALAYAVDQYDIDPVMEDCVNDMLLSGRGVVRVNYEADIETVQVPFIDPVTQEVSSREQEYIGSQTSECEYVYWEDFRMSPARRWKDVRWVSFRHYMTRKEVTELSPEHGAKVPLNHAPKVDDQEDIPDTFKRAEVWEIWDKTRRERVWVVCGYAEILRTDEDPYELEKFFPIPEPLYSITETRSLVPIPEYTLYQDQAMELNRVTTRINKLTEALKHRGVYDASVEALKKLADAEDNEFIGVDGAAMANLMEKGGVANVFQEMDIATIANVLIQLYQNRQQLLDTIYQVTGISDIIRGSSDARETAAAQRIKSQFGSMRLQARQRRVQRFIRDLSRIKAEIMVEHYEPEILSEMTQVQVTPEAMQLMRDDRLRSYHVDIETDSTVFEDEQASKQATNEFLASVTQFITGVGPVAMQQPVLLPLFGEMLTMGVRQYKQGRQIEEKIEETMAALQQQAQSQQGQQPPDPALIKVQQDAQIQQMKLQQQAQTDAAKLQAQQQQNVLDFRLKQHEIAEDDRIRREEIATDAALERRQQDMQAQTQRYAASQRTMGE
jgi:hypothetical protein